MHSAAGGVGHPRGAAGPELGASRVVATASTPEKRELARELGADVAGSTPASTTWPVRSSGTQRGQPVDVVLEMVGGKVFDASLAALAPFGRLATFGSPGLAHAALAGATPLLMATSRAVAGFWLVHALRLPGGLRPGPGGALRPCTRPAVSAVLDGAGHPLAEARRAHEALRARRTTGKLTLDCTDHSPSG